MTQDKWLNAQFNRKPNTPKTEPHDRFDNSEFDYDEFMQLATATATFFTETMSKLCFPTGHAVLDMYLNGMLDKDTTSSILKDCGFDNSNLEDVTNQLHTIIENLAQRLDFKNKTDVPYTVDSVRQLLDDITIKRHPDNLIPTSEIIAGLIILTLALEHDEGAFFKTEQEQACHITKRTTTNGNTQLHFNCGHDLELAGDQTDRVINYGDIRTCPFCSARLALFLTPKD